MKNSFLVRLQWGMIVVFTLLIGLLIFQNISIKRDIVNQQQQVHKNSASVQFSDNLKARIQFKKSPVSLDLKEYYFKEKFKVDFVNSYLVIVFDLTVCGECLFQELDVLKRMKSQLEEKKVFIMAIIGISTEKEKSQIIEHFNAGTFFFPCKTIPANSIYSTFGISKDRFLDTPFYLYTSHQQQILDIFKPPYLKTEEFKTWLNILANQDVL